MDDFPPRSLEQTTRAENPTRRRSLLRRLAPFLLVLLLLGLAGWWLTPSPTSGPSGGRFAQGGPTPVGVALARTGDMPVTLNGLGTVTSLATVTVKSQISGYITQIAFTEGKDVKEGDFIVQIDPRPYQVALEQAQGALARDQALLANAKVDVARYETLFKQDSIAEQQVATQRALVAQDEGTVKTDQAQIDSARLSLAYCHLTAPVSGRLGLRQVDIGNYVTPGDSSGIVVITQIKPITVEFPVPEDSVPDIVKQIHAGKTLAVTAYDRSHTTKLAVGTLLSIDSQIDTSTGTLKIRASFPNDDESLFPNQFVNVDLLLDTLTGVTLVPQSAVQRGAPGTFVYVVKRDDSTVGVRKVTLGPGNATDVAIAKGLAPGETVVVDGADRLKDGAKVLLPAADPNAPPPADGQTHHRGNGQWQGQHGDGQGGGRQRNGHGDGSGGAPQSPAPQQ
jgi:multidrug efflux system membrane fusion protein